MVFLSDITPGKWEQKMCSIFKAERVTGIKYNLVGTFGVKNMKFPEIPSWKTEIICATSVFRKNRSNAFLLYLIQKLIIIAETLIYPQLIKI